MHTDLSSSTNPLLHLFSNGIFFPRVFLSLPSWHFRCLHKMPSIAWHLTFFSDFPYWWPSFSQALIIIFHKIWCFLALSEVTWSWLCLVWTETILVSGGVLVGFQLNLFVHIPDRVSYPWLRSVPTPLSSACNKTWGVSFMTEHSSLYAQLHC